MKKKAANVPEKDLTPSQMAKQKIVDVIFMHLNNGALNLVDIVELSSLLTGEVVRIINKSDEQKKLKKDAKPI